VKTIVLRVEEAPAGAAGYPVRLLAAEPANGPTLVDLATATLPVALDDPPLLDPSGQRMDPAAIIRTLLSQAGHSDLFLRIGQHLHGMLSRGDVATKWDGLIASADAPGGEGLRTMLDIRPEPLRRLPWELLARGQKRMFLFGDKPFMRGSGQFEAPPPPELPPLRVLIVVGCRQDEIQAEQEVASILQTLARAKGALEAEVVTGPSLEQLVRSFSEWRPHVLHFIGHGSMSPGIGAVLEICHGEERWELTRDTVLHTFGGAGGRLVVLNACRTSAGDHTSAAEATWSLADAFRACGYLAVIGLQADVDARMAARFSAPLYQQIAEGKPLDVAVAVARSTMAQAPGASLDRRDWCLPALTLAVAPDQVLALAAPAPRVNVAAAPEFAGLRAFVDRAPERRELWAADPPDGWAHPPRELMAVVGPQRCGKTSLLWHCLRTSALRGREVRYVNLASASRLDFVAALRRIRDGRAGSPLQAPLPQAAFHAFNYDLNHLVRGVSPPPYDPVMGPVLDAGEALQPGVEDVIERIFASFRSALREAAGGSPLLIALDHVVGVEPENFRFLAANLCLPVAQQTVDSVRLVVALSTEELDQLWPKELQLLAPPIAVTSFPPDDLPLLVREYLLHHDVDGEQLEHFDTLLPLLTSGPGTWDPLRLRSVLTALAGQP
jgi:hypothetical protein